MGSSRRKNRDRRCAVCNTFFTVHKKADGLARTLCEFCLMGRDWRAGESETYVMRREVADK